ncbi:hypothetical protein ACSTIV_20470 [Vibrio parahaemolyticus]|nr:hypothetical protein [Vibrio parahaemolyticus]HCG7760963.1 hypothetical protein [Vibrio parahaemolyticus]
MYRRIRYSESDYHLSYLNISAHYINNGICSGQFQNYLKKTFGINKLPYNIKIIDLIRDDSSKYELFVELPEEYFNEWESYPELGVIKSTEATKATGAIYSYIDIISTEDEGLPDLLHPYESIFLDEFVNKLKSRPSNPLVTKTHRNGREYRPCEFYLSYWRAYIIFETVNNCKFIENYLVEEKGKPFFEAEYQRVNDYWVSNYSSTFQRVATYRSFASRFALSKAGILCTYGEASSFVLEHLQATRDDLESDMTILLTLHRRWESLAKREELNSYNVGLRELKKDIYFMFEWLCSSGLSEHAVFDRWSYDGRQSRYYSALKDVLDFEEIKFKESFTRYVPLYVQPVIYKWFNKEINLDNLYLKLEGLNSFYPWMRSFHDLHESINNKSSIHLVQPRIIDYLLIFTIRTEIIIRDLVYSNFSYEEYNLKDVISELSSRVEKENDKKVLCCVVDKEKWDMTKLDGKPNDIFERIDSCSVGKCWSLSMKYFFAQILKFVTSRNYFAHHSYKDDELNLSINTLPREVLTSCLYSVLYLASLLDTVASKDK